MRLIHYLFLLMFITLNSCAEDKMDKYNKLTPEEERVIINKGTEMPYSGKYWNSFEQGTYVCKRCNAPLYKSDDKFQSNCGWPSFDDEIEGAVKRIPDKDGVRTEIVCNNCGAHLGHVFVGERLTEKNTRHCVNSISMAFVPTEFNEPKYKKAVFASGCFWGTEYMFRNMTGVVKLTVGYTGGHVENPTYKEVCTGETGHLEALEIIYDSTLIDYETLAKRFFETHDPTQTNGQGPDIGEQYLSAIFYFDDTQKATAEKLINILETKGLKIATKVLKAMPFYKAEDYHQNYYEKKGSTPYCHYFRKLF